MGGALPHVGARLARMPGERNEPILGDSDHSAADNPLKRLNRLVGGLIDLVESRLWARVLMGLFAGALVGAMLGRPTRLIPDQVGAVIANWLALPGDLFIRLVQMIMIPLVLASIIQGIAGEGKREGLVQLSARVGAYFLATTVFAIVLGLGVASWVRPGRGMHLVAPGVVAPQGGEASFGDIPSMITGLVPSNPLASMLAGEMLSLVIFAFIVGAALIAMPKEKSAPLLELVTSVQEICMIVTKWTMRLAPAAVFGLMTRTIASSGLGVLAGLGLYVLTVLACLLVLLAFYSLVLAIFSKVQVVQFFRSSKDVLLLAFSVASSAAVMPLSMKTAEEKLGVPIAVSRFVIPLGAIVNMNGTAAYQAVATLFLAQVYGLDLDVPTLALVVVTAVAASIGTPSAPGAGIIVLASVLTTAGVPAEGISVIIGVDHLLGMCRTAVNVTGDLTACAVFKDFGDGGQADLPAPVEA